MNVSTSVQGFVVIMCFLATVFGVVMPGFADEDVNFVRRSVDIWSDGTRLSGDIFVPKTASEENPAPAIVLCHGWGGVKSHLNETYAPKFAAAGFVVLTFDYRGWGESDSRMVLVGEQPEANAQGEAEVSVRLIRELVDPFDELEDIQSAIAFVEGEPGVDVDRIGLWGTSFGGSLVTWTAAHDARVKCVVSQVAPQDLRVFAVASAGGLEGQHEKEIERARGERAPVPQGEDAVPGLRGTPYVSHFAKYAPIDHADSINVPVLFIDAENEELFDRHENSEKLHALIKDRVETVYHVEKGIKHYGIYRERYTQGSDLALEWFKDHL